MNWKLAGRRCIGETSELASLGNGPIAHMRLVGDACVIEVLADILMMNVSFAAD